MTIEKNMHVLVLKFNLICDLGVVNPSMIDRQDGINNMITLVKFVVVVNACFI